MISNQDKIDIIIWRLNNIEGDIKSFIDNAEKFKDKYSLEEELIICNAKKEALLYELNTLGGSWINP
jgi:hypothetical protein